MFTASRGLFSLVFIPWGKGDGGTQRHFIRGGSAPRSNFLPFYTAISRKVDGKNVDATIPKGNMGYDQYDQ